MESLDRIFDLLSKERRRYVLYYLEQRDGPVSVDELTEKVVEWETDSAVASIPEGKFENVKLNLYHNDLPKASEITHIEYDADNETVELVGEPPEFKAIISVAEIVERPYRNP